MLESPTTDAPALESPEQWMERTTDFGEVSELSEYDRITSVEDCDVSGFTHRVRFKTNRDHASSRVFGRISRSDDLSQSSVDVNDDGTLSVAVLVEGWS
jgi:hypothetical protein